jgi:hypothetical protein
MAQGVREQKASKGKSYLSKVRKKTYLFSNKYLVFYESDRVSPEKRHELLDDDII